MTFDSLRELGKAIGVEHPQKVKHHLLQMEKEGYIRVNWKEGSVKLLEKETFDKEPASFFSIPVLGAANCGEATLLAEENPEGLLIVSKRMLNPRDQLFAVRAVGDSMNQAKINNKDNIEEGDYIVIDPKDKDIRQGSYVLSIINGSANVKRFYRDPDNHQVVLCSESNRNYPPIYIHEDDNPDFLVNGKVVAVVKRPPISRSSHETNAIQEMQSSRR
jgi:SOS-response transcriptional repressor LexA